MNDIQQTIFDYINAYFKIENDPDFTPDVNIFDYGFVDSLGAVEILDFIESHWNIEITTSDLTLFPMNSVEEIAAVVARKTASNGK
jgi:D-alanine--poly(phosphoribitol) ligase subunit 2